MMFFVFFKPRTDVKILTGSYYGQQALQRILNILKIRCCRLALGCLATGPKAQLWY